MRLELRVFTQPHERRTGRILLECRRPCRSHPAARRASMVEQLVLELAPAPPPTYANFVAGRNGEALGALIALGRRNADERFVYLWGESGGGRTHLLLATVAAARDAGMKAHYVAAEDWPGTAFAADALLAADDVDRLDAASQVALFDAFNRLRAGGGRLLAAGSAAPRDLALRDDLRTRLGWGLAFQVHPLLDAEKSEAMRARARSRGMELGDEMIDYLLARLPRDMGALAAVVDALDRYSLARKRPLTIALAREALATLNNTRVR